ncbi:MAG: aspartyl protease family protein [bacterium]
MKKYFLILLIFFIISGASFILSGCGGGGGGGGNSGSQTQTQPTVPPINSGYSNIMNVYLDEYSDENAPNIPYVYVYINGGSTPIPLLLDTGVTGILINKSALTAAGDNVTSNSNTFSVTFGDGTTASGYVNDIDVSTASAGGGLTAANIPVAVAAGDSAFPSSGFLQGDFGMGLSPYYSFGQSGTGTVYTPSFTTAVSNSYYNNGFILDFNNLSFVNGYEVISSPQTAAVGTITFGLDTVSDNAIPAGSEFYANAAGQTQGFPMLTSLFGGYLSDSSGYTFYSFLDTGSNFIYIGTDALDDSIGSGGSTTDVISSGSCQGFIYGGLQVYFSLLNAAGNFMPNNFITAPDSASNNSFCDYSAVTNIFGSNALALGNAVLDGGSQQGQEDFGLPFIFNLPAYWQAQISGSGGSNWGVGIE